MAFTVLPDGSIKADTVEEMRAALAVVREQSSQPRTPPKPASPPVEPASPPLAPVISFDQREGYRALYEQLLDQPQQQALLRALVAATHYLTDAELRRELGLSSNLDLRGLLIGIVRRATNRKLANPIAKQMTRLDGGRRRSYRYAATSAFRAAMDGYEFREKVTA